LDATCSLMPYLLRPSLGFTTVDRPRQKADSTADRTQIANSGATGRPLSESLSALKCLRPEFVVITIHIPNKTAASAVPVCVRERLDRPLRIVAELTQIELQN
jgi:hypothetical protein